jgi:hypothetical protein
MLCLTMYNVLIIVKKVITREQSWKIMGFFCGTSLISATTSLNAFLFLQWEFIDEKTILIKIHLQHFLLRSNTHIYFKQLSLFEYAFLDIFWNKKEGPDRGSNPEPRAPEARIIPLDHQAVLLSVHYTSVNSGPYIHKNLYS